MSSLFKAAEATMFKLEVKQVYPDDHASLSAWRYDDKDLSRGLWEADANNAARAARCLGSTATIQRVHVVPDSREDYTSYLEWEIEVVYKSLVRSGAEKVGLAPVARLEDVKIPDGDFWIFDGVCVLQWVYNKKSGNEVAGCCVWEEVDKVAEYSQIGAVILGASDPVTL
jgi:hypothetical protein